MSTHCLPDLQKSASDMARNGRTTPRGQTILFVLPWNLTYPGGVNQVVANLFDACEPALGLRPLLLVKSWVDRSLRVANIDGRQTVHVRLRRPPVGSPRIPSILIYLFALPTSLWRLGVLLNQEHVRVINVHYPDLDALTWLLLRCFKKNMRLVLSFHGTDSRQAARASGLEKKLWRLLLTHADAVVACSRSLLSALSALGCPSTRITVIPNGVAPDIIDTFARREPRFPLPTRYLVSLATFEFKKGLDVLLRAFALVAPADSSLHLVVAGRIGDQHCLFQLLNIRDKLGLTARVTFLPDLEHAEAMAVLARSEALVLPSRIEPFGIVILEAGVLGIPVVATSACGVVEYLTAGADLLVVPPEDVEALAAALTRLLAAPTEARSLAQRLRLRVVNEFNWSQIALHYATTFGVQPAPPTPPQT